MKTITPWRIGTDADIEKAFKFFYSVRNETNPPFTTYPHGIRGTLEILLADGRLLLAEVNDEIVGLLGYFHGIPKLDDQKHFNYSQTEKAYIYCFVIAPEHRGPVSFALLPFLGKTVIADGHTEARFKAYKEHNTLINRLYRQYGHLIGEETNMQGALSNLYSGDPFAWANKFTELDTESNNAAGK